MSNKKKEKTELAKLFLDDKAEGDCKHLEEYAGRVVDSCPCKYMSLGLIM
jgi:hypothetical protein